VTGLELRMLREGAGLTRAALAQLVGVSEQTVWRWESGRVRVRGVALVALVSVLKAGEGLKGEES
jgi:DNA-binding transcriptional regulator YiaG